MLQARKQFPSLPTSSAAARAWSAQILDGWGYDGDVANVALVVSELVTNAIVHGGEPLELHLRSKGTGLQVRVNDQGTWKQPEQPPGAGEGCRGLALVRALSSGWGVEQLGGYGTIVWANVRP